MADTTQRKPLPEMVQVLRDWMKLAEIGRQRKAAAEQEEAQRKLAAETQTTTSLTNA